MNVFEAEDLAFAYNGIPVLRRVSFAVRSGALVCLLGPNGCGKTTLLRLMLGLLAPTGGHLLLAGRKAHAMPRREMAGRVAYVPQLHRMAFAYTVLEMVLMGRTVKTPFPGRPSSRDRDIAMNALCRFSIEHLADVPVTQLSGGQRQLTILARALAQRAQAFVLDEPMTGLDFGHQAKFLEILRELCAEGHTCVMSTHFPDHALWVADHVLMLREGHVVADGAPRDVVTSENLGRLYDTDISVHRIGETIRVCVPDRIGGIERGAPNGPAGLTLPSRTPNIDGDASRRPEGTPNALPDL
uniref:ABC-type cobalamin/Fe3+-siderophore transport system, ATPase component n=1 Tax=Desulfovibrio sp. U5L TaxID=596152 RepID=I2Q3C6_9BACT